MQELLRLREELALAEADAAAEEQRTSQSEAAALAALARSESEAAARELEIRASIAAHREQLACRQREASSLRATLEEREALEAQATELRAKLVNAKAWQLHRQLVAAQRDGRAALEALESDVSVATTERQQLDAELSALCADRDRLLLDVTSCVQGKQNAAAQLVAAKRDLAFATLDSEAAQARAARVRLLGGGGAVLSSPHPGASQPEQQQSGNVTAAAPPQRSSSPAAQLQGSDGVDVLAAAEADSAATLAEMRSLLLSLQGHTSAGSTAIASSRGPPISRLPSDSDLAVGL